MTTSCSALLLGAGLSLSLLLPQAVNAQQPTQGPAADQLPPADPHPAGSDDFHAPIVVTAGLARLDLLAGTSVLAGVELQRNLGTQIGEVLSRVPGVSATSFSPGASRPVLRGLQGDRVRVLTDGLGSLDASGASADHAVAIDPLIAERIEVLRGPAVLLYGSQAMGGAVNVVSKRMPARLVEELVHIDGHAALDTASNRRETGLSLDLPLGGGFGFHIDGSYHEGDDLEIPGFVLSAPLPAQLLADAASHEAEGEAEEAEELREAAGQRGVLPNSATQTRSFGTGLGFFSGNSSLAAAFSYYDSDYGVPSRPGLGHFHVGEEHGHDHDHDHGHEEEGHHHHGDVPVTIGLKQYRADLRGVLDLGEGVFDEVRARFGYSDYTHTEFEGGEVGTTFDVEGVEGRVELVQSRRGGWGGSVGAQYGHVDFVATGAEAFMPPNVTETFALFAVQELALDPLEFELGGRYERTAIEAASVAAKRSFDTWSAAAGLSYGLSETMRLGVNGSRAERAPSAQELFADGPHVATQQFELGNASLDKEGSWGIEAYLRGQIGPASLSLGAYRNWFDHFIFLDATGAEKDGLPVFAYQQQDARHFGIEAEISAPIYERGGFRLLADLSADYVRATLADGSPVPRIPPLSLLAGLEARQGHFDARAEVQWFDQQTRLAPLETATDSFAFVNLSLAWHPVEGANNVTVMLQADNVFDAEGRRHASFTKDFVPLSGRNVKLSARVSF